MKEKIILRSRAKSLQPLVRIGKSGLTESMVEEISINHLLTETDSPYLGPEKDGRNEPAFVTQTVRKIAELKRFDPLETENAIFMNYKSLF